MSAPRRIVIDTNVLVSSLLVAHSVPDQAVRLALFEHRVLISEAVLAEIRAVLGRKKLARFIAPKVRAAFLDHLARVAINVPVDTAVSGCRDPRDDKFLELAVNGKADYLLTGDEDLLVMDPFREVRIVTPMAFLKEYAPGGKQKSQ